MLLPLRWPLLNQRVLYEVPKTCPKCGNRWLVVDGRRVSCAGIRAGCGADWFLVRRP